MKNLPIRLIAHSVCIARLRVGIGFSGPVAERLPPGLVSERKRTFHELFWSLRNPRAAVNAVLGFSLGFANAQVNEQYLS